MKTRTPYPHHAHSAAPSYFEAAASASRKASQAFEPGGDPYNTSDRLKADREREALFVEWLNSDVEEITLCSR